MMHCRRLLLTATFPSLSSCFSSNLAFITYKKNPYSTILHHPWLINSRIKNNSILLHQFFATSSKEDDNNTASSTSTSTSTSTISKSRNIYQVWTIEDDKLLLKNQDKSIPYLASLLNRGLQGVKARLSKLKNVNNPAYIRLAKQQEGDYNSSDDEKTISNKLIPVGEVLRRIKWDTSFTLSDFSIGYYDRVDDTIHECTMDATNDSIKGKERLFVFALPEHRISYVKYKERIVWDKESRIDIVSESENMHTVINTYGQWELQQNEQKEIVSQKEKYIKNQLKLLLGNDRYIELKDISFQLQLKYEEQQQAVKTNIILPKSSMEKFIQQILNMYRNAMIEINNDEQYGFLQLDNDNNNNNNVEEEQEIIIQDNQKQSLFIPKTELQFLDLLSELVSFLPNVILREQILIEIENTVMTIQLENNNNNKSKKNNKTLPKLNEDELDESFIRGSGAGGQKINKTSNKVVLVHKPTNLRVECQETRSLTQNRKIARKRLQLKIEEFMLGSQSRVGQKAAIKSDKKAKSKARSKARLKKKQEAKALKKQQKSNDDFDEYPF